MTTPLAPARARSSETARPTPVPPPVTSATAPFSCTSPGRIGADHGVDRASRCEPALVKAESIDEPGGQLWRRRQLGERCGPPAGGAGQGQVRVVGPLLGREARCLAGGVDPR